MLIDHGMITDVLLWIIRTAVSSDIQLDRNVHADVVLDTPNNFSNLQFTRELLRCLL